jgi:hypothetical protein
MAVTADFYKLILKWIDLLDLPKHVLNTSHAKSAVKISRRDKLGSIMARLSSSNT